LRARGRYAANASARRSASAFTMMASCVQVFLEVLRQFVGADPGGDGEQAEVIGSETRRARTTEGGIY
jgi:hypothetical protein